MMSDINSQLINSCNAFVFECDRDCDQMASWPDVTGPQEVTAAT